MKMEGLEYLQSLAPLGMTGNLDNMERMLDFLKHPEKKFQTIHVVGTDGKGSTAYYLSNILSAHGISSGLYTSPHLVNVRERIRIDGQTIPEKDLDRILLQVRTAAESLSLHVSFFEVLTLAGFLFFAERNVGCAVVEAGLGGRLDSTRTAGGKLSVLTSIGLEHTELLGKTEREILHEKLGILSEGSTILVGGISPELHKDVCEFVRKISGKAILPKILENLQVKNSGHHYIENASLSFEAAKEFLGERFDENIARKALENSLWLGRMQRLQNASCKCLWILDGAHNSHAVKRLAETLRADYPNVKFHCVFGALQDKDLSEMIELLKPNVSEWHVTRTPYVRFREIEQVASELKRLGCSVGTSAPMSKKFLEKVQGESAENPVLITGSLYMIGQAIDLLKSEFESLAFFRGLVPSESEAHGIRKN